MSILVDESTTFIIQGITGREAVTMTRELIDYGSKVIGGVTPAARGGRCTACRWRTRCAPSRRAGRSTPR